MHPWWECRNQLVQVRPALACSMRHSKVALHAHIANNVGICWQLPALVPYKRCSQVGAIFEGNVFQQTTIVVSAVDFSLACCIPLLVVVVRHVCFQLLGCWKADPASHVWWQCNGRKCNVQRSHLLPSRTIHTVDGSACCIVCKQ